MFIMIGVIAVSVSIYLFSVFKLDSTNDLEDMTKYNNEGNSIAYPVKEYIESCLERQGNHALDWALLENGKYEKGTATQDPDLPTLLTFDLWMHTFQPDFVNLESIPNNMEVYLDDTMPYCLDSFNSFDKDLKIITDNSSATYKVKINGNNIIIYMEYPILFELKDKKEKITSFQYTINYVPLNQIKKDVDTLISTTYRILYSVDGRTDGSSPMRWGNIDNAIKLFTDTSTVVRDDLDIVVLTENNTYQYILFYSNRWRDTYYVFNIIDKSSESIGACPYCNNVVNGYYGTYQTLNPNVSADITVPSSYFVGNPIYE